MARIDTLNPPNEMPDIVGEKPANPFLASFKPHVPASARIRELTPMPLIVGTLLGIIFGASSLYLVLKVGLTVSASIPVAVLSITIFRMLSKLGLRKDATILENNIVQTAGSAGESIAFGLGVTMPAIMILGFDLEIARVTLVAVTGGLLGILMMIPLRRAMIVDQHGILKYPEGTACAAVLKAAEKPDGGTTAVSSHSKIGTGQRPSLQVTQEEEAARGGGKTIFSGFAIGFIYYVFDKALYCWKEIPEKIFGPPFKAASVGLEINPALLGVGYIIGPRIGSIMCAGGVLAYLVLIPAIKFFGEHVVGAVPPGTMPISEMVPDDIREAYVLYIGAGAVAAGGIISMVRSMPTIWHGLKSGLADLRGTHGRVGATPRTDQDLSMKFVIGGTILLLLIIMVAPQLHLKWNLLGALLIVVIGFLFTTVSSRLTGEIGSSSCPTSGITVATLLLTCFVFLIVGWSGPPYFVTALSIGAIVCIASSNGGTTSQDLKTGFLVGSTPRSQQIAILFGTLASALVLGPILLGLNDVYTVYVPASKLEATVASLRAPADQLDGTEQLKGPQAAEDHKTYRVWQRPDPSGGAAQRYLVNDDGTVAYLVDPGINGTHKTRPDGTTVDKFIAPKATLMSYIIKGILGHQLPWALVLLGVMIAITLEMSGIPSLAFAVGVYLPLSSSSPIFVGGMVRWLVDRWLRRKKFRDHRLSEEELVAEGDRSPGVLLASGYIAGGALSGIVIAFMTGLPALIPINQHLQEWQTAHNPFFDGPWANALALIPFAIICLLLYLVGRDVLLRPRTQFSK
jgi:putative OPT family oligopeptide transporter